MQGKSTTLAELRKILMLVYCKFRISIQDSSIEILKVSAPQSYMVLSAWCILILSLTEQHLAAFVAPCKRPGSLEAAAAAAAAAVAGKR